MLLSEIVDGVLSAWVVALSPFCGASLVGGFGIIAEQIRLGHVGAEHMVMI